MDKALLATYERRLPRYTSYPTAPHFHPGVDAATYRGWLEATDPEAIASLYLHIPFCRAMCWYCGCHTTVAKNDGPVAQYVDLLAQEIERVARTLPHRLKVSHVHWGGGTPNLLSSEQLRRLSDVLASQFEVLPDAEIAIELDPRTVDREKIRTLAECGVTRASLGIQDIDEKVQAAINRHQPYVMTARAVELLREEGVEDINADLIYGLPYQTAAGMEATLEQVLRLAPDRVALFGYAHVPWMKSHQRLIPEDALPGTEERAAQYQAASAYLAANGYRRIGIDHFARAEDAMARAAEAGDLHRNFQGYTTDRAKLLLGFGASAIGSLPQGYVQNEPSIAGWRERIAEGGLAAARGIAISDDDRLRRSIIERLMCDLEVDLDAECRRHGVDPDELLAERERVDDLAREGLGWREGWRVGVAERDRPLVRALCAVFDRYLAATAARHSRVV